MSAREGSPPALRAATPSWSEAERCASVLEMCVSVCASSACPAAPTAASSLPQSVGRGCACQRSRACHSDCAPTCVAMARQPVPLGPRLLIATKSLVSSSVHGGIPSAWAAAHPGSSCPRAVGAAAWALARAGKVVAAWACSGRTGASAADSCCDGDACTTACTAAGADGHGSAGLDSSAGAGNSASNIFAQRTHPSRTRITSVTGRTKLCTVLHVGHSASNKGGALPAPVIRDLARRWSAPSPHVRPRRRASAQLGPADDEKRFQAWRAPPDPRYHSLTEELTL